jgi:hypothetical protein
LLRETVTIPSRVIIRNWSRKRRILVKKYRLRIYYKQLSLKSIKEFENKVTDMILFYVR